MINMVLIKLNGLVFYYIVPETVINNIYFIEEVLCILLVMLLVIVSLFEIRNIHIKILFTISGLLALIMHYYIIWYMTRFENIALYPIVVVETTSRGSSISIDFGQLVLIGILIVWRKQIINYFMKNLKK